MIRFKINTHEFNAQVKKVTSAISDLPNAQNVSNMSRAVASIAAQEFVKSLNREARSIPKTYHHLYEWNKTGVDSQRLFRVKRVSSGNRSSVEINLKPSRTQVPLAKQLTTPGKTNKSVTRRSVFKNKAEVMERKRGTKAWVAQRNIVFLGNGSLIFKKKGFKMRGVRSPGGPATTYALRNYAKRWQGGMAIGAVDKSRIFKKIEDRVAETLSGSNPTSTSVRSVIKEVCSSYDIGSGEI